MPVEKRRLIVTGVARSGTTALATLLNSHEGICLGIERFKFRFLRENDFSPDFFERDRFFDFRPQDTDIRPDARPAWTPAYEDMAAKWDKAQIVGDKVPDLIPVLAPFLTRNPDFSCIIITRNLRDVALSWQARADRSSDSWPKGKGFLVACESWTQQHDILHDLMRKESRPENLLLLDYDKMYDNIDLLETALLGFLGLGPSSAFRATLDAHRGFVRRRKTRKVPDGFRDVLRAADMSRVRGLRNIAREQLERLAAQGVNTADSRDRQCDLPDARAGE